MRLFFYPNPLDKRVIIPRQRMVSKIKNRYFIEYQGEVMKLSEFAKIVGVDYNRLRHRVQRGQNLFDPLPEVRANINDEESYPGYSLEELAEMYSRFRDEEDALDILADFSCQERRGKGVEKLRQDIEKYLEEKRKEVQG